MFVNALHHARQITFPIAVSFRTLDGRVRSGCAAGIVLDADCHVLTAAHVFEPLMKRDADLESVAKYNQAVAAVNADKALQPQQRKKALKRIKSDKDWVTNASVMFAIPGGPPTCEFTVTCDPLRDLALATVPKIDPARLTAVPTFAEAGFDLEPGTSVCRLGFPFHQLDTTFDPATGQFNIPNGPPAAFPMDGIMTRVAKVESEDGSRSADFIETSTPGLRGQSGGPLLTASCVLVGVQSKTFHLPLGFSPEIEIDHKTVTEHQFLNVGVATHYKEVIAFLNEQGVTVAQSAPH